MTPISPEQLRDELAHFTGSETWHRTINRSVTYTDGVAHFAEKAGTYWLLDILATELPKLVAVHNIIFLTVKVASQKARLKAVADEGLPTLWKKCIDYTDCPEGEWKFYMAQGGPAGTMVIMLPSEY